MPCATATPIPEPGWALRDRWEAIQFGLLQGPYRPYKEVLAESLRLWTEERGYPWDDADGEALVRSMRSWQPFPDTRASAAPGQGARGLKLVIISNTDRDIIEHTLRHLAVPFDDVITAQDCGAYKPSPLVFRASAGAHRRGARAASCTWRSASSTTSRRPRRSAAGRPGSTASSRRGPDPATPDYEWRDLWGLAELVGGPGPVPPSNAPASLADPECLARTQDNQKRMRAS